MGLALFCFLAGKIELFCLKEARSLLARAHAALLVDGELLEILRSLRKDGESLEKRDGSELNFVELGSVWQAPLYEIILNLCQDHIFTENEGWLH